MFYEIVNGLCKARKTTITKMSEEIGLSNAAATSWKRGSIPKSSTLQKISEYFGVSTDYLLGKEPMPLTDFIGYIAGSETDTKKPADQKADGLRDAGYYELTPENQKMIDGLIEKLLKSQSGE
jgi:transcriptional regulator with XRE-family HTH domain